MGFRGIEINSRSVFRFLIQPAIHELVDYTTQQLIQSGHSGTLEIEIYEFIATKHSCHTFHVSNNVTEFRQPLQVQSHLEMPRILVQLGHTQCTWKLAPQTDPKWSPTWSLTRFQPICPLSARDGRYACQVSRAHRTHSRL